MGYENLINDETIGPTVLKIALAIQAEAATIATGFVRTGNLRNSISVSMQGFYNSIGSAEKQISQPSDPQTAHVGSAVEYALAKEYGLPEKPGYPADPYMRPARDVVYAQAGKISGKELQERLDSYANRYPHRVKVMEAKS